MAEKGEWQGRKYDDLTSDSNVQLWLEEIGRNSKAVAEAGRNRLGLFLSVNGLTAKSLVEMEKRPRDDLIARFIRDREKRGLLQDTNQTVLRYIRSYLHFNDLEVRKIPLKKTGSNSENERVPLREEVADILYHRKAPPRAVAEIAFMAFSGVRPEVLGNYEGTDGLRVGDIEDLRVDGGKVTFAKIPAKVNVRWNLSKNRKKYFTFLPEEGCQALKDHLEYIAGMGETLSPELPIALASYRLQHRGQYRDRKPHPLSTQDVGNEIRRVLRPKYTFRPYLFRSYFDTALEMAESKRAITHSQRQFWMGHNGDIEAVYSTRKALNGDMIEEFRKAFAEASKHIQTRGEGPLEVAKTEFEAKDKELDESMARLRLENLELKERLREHDKLLAQVLEEIRANRKTLEK
jgi:hypothetical protein